MFKSLSNKAVLVIGLSAVISSPAMGSSKVISQVEKLNRCYNRFVNSPIQTSGDSTGAKLYAQVAKGTKTGTAACLELLDIAMFDTSGMMKNPNSQEAKLIVQNFHNFHNSFFKANALNYNSLYNNMTALVRDIDEPSLYYTQALFGGKNLSNAVTSTSVLKSVRTSNLKKENYISRTINPLHFTSLSAENKTIPLITMFENDLQVRAQRKDYAKGILDKQFADQIKQAAAIGDETAKRTLESQIINGANDYSRLKGITLNDSEVVGQGEMIGITTRSARNLRLPEVDAYAGVDLDKNQYLSNNIFAHLGGGILGTPMYLMKNTNLAINSYTGGNGTDPYSNVPRRFTARIYEDLLCHVLPTLKPADAASDVDTNSSHGFRQSSSCMSCHSSFDPLAGVYRNITVGVTAAAMNDNENQRLARSVGTPIFTIRKLVPTGTGKGVVSASAPYPLQKPEGRLMYRDHTGGLVKRTVASIGELGTAIAESDDFYRCVAKRYYHYLTGIDVNLYAPDADLSAAGKKQKATVFQMGRILKGTDYANSTEKTTYAANKQNLRLLIKYVLDSESFNRRDLGLTGE